MHTKQSPQLISRSQTSSLSPALLSSHRTPPADRKTPLTKSSHEIPRRKLNEIDPARAMAHGSSLTDNAISICHQIDRVEKRTENSCEAVTLSAKVDTKSPIDYKLNFKAHGKTTAVPSDAMVSHGHAESQHVLNEDLVRSRYSSSNSGISPRFSVPNTPLQAESCHVDTLKPFTVIQTAELTDQKAVTRKGIGNDNKYPNHTEQDRVQSLVTGVELLTKAADIHLSLMTTQSHQGFASSLPKRPSSHPPRLYEAIPCGQQSSLKISNCEPQTIVEDKNSLVLKEPLITTEFIKQPSMCNTNFDISTLDPDVLEAVRGITLLSHVSR